MPAPLIARVRLAREGNLNWTVNIAKNARKTVDVMEDQRCTFVGGETPSEANRQHLIIEQSIGGCYFRLPIAATLALERHSITEEVNEPLS